MKKQFILIAFIFVTFDSYTQIHKTNSLIAYKKLNTISENNAIQNKWDETIFKLKPLLNSKNTNYKKIEIRNDTIQVAEKISVKSKTQYNITKFPLKKLVDITFSFKELVIYAKRKEVIVNRYQYKKLKTSELTLFKKLKKEDGTILKELFQQLIAINNFDKSN